MFIDILVLLVAVSAVIKGYRTGVIMALFNTVSLLIGLLAAVKFSSVVTPFLAPYFGSFSKWTPLIAFGLVFMVVMVMIRMAGKTIEKMFESVKVGFINGIAGSALYLLINLAVLSIVLYYLGRVGIPGEQAANDSATYRFIAPWGPAILDLIGSILPFFQDMFEDLNDFFDDLNNRIKEQG